MSLLAMSQKYRVRPSVLLDIQDSYTSYCLDEACAYIMAKLDAGEELVFRTKYTSFTELYNQYN